MDRQGETEGTRPMAKLANWNNLVRVQKRPGVTRRVFTGEKTMMVINELAAGAKPDLHQHPHEQLTYIVEGTCRFVLGDEVMDLGPGDVVAIPGGVPHSLEVTSTDPVLNLDVFTPIREDFLLANS